jgi:perosamine synthetase
MTNIQAAIGLAQFKRIDELAEMRRRNAHLYNKYLEGVEGICLPVEREWAKNVYWMYSILVEDGYRMSRDELMDRLMEYGIDTRMFFIPMHEQPVFWEMGLFEGERYPVAEELSRKGMYLPSSSGLKENEIKYVCEAIVEIKEESRL